MPQFKKKKKKHKHHSPWHTFIKTYITTSLVKLAELKTNKSTFLDAQLHTVNPDKRYIYILCTSITLSNFLLQQSFYSVSHNGSVKELIASSRDPFSPGGRATTTTNFN